MNKGLPYIANRLSIKTYAKYLRERKKNSREMSNTMGTYGCLCNCY